MISKQKNNLKKPSLFTFFLRDLPNDVFVEQMTDLIQFLDLSALLEFLVHAKTAVSPKESPLRCLLQLLAHHIALFIILEASFAQSAFLTQVSLKLHLLIIAGFLG